ncbi:MAG: lytic transglycosylase F, partial [Pseudomonadota bacterium]
MSVKPMKPKMNSKKSKKAIYLHLPKVLIFLHAAGLYAFLTATSAISAKPDDVSDNENSLRKVVKLDEKWTGDFDGMVKRRFIRALVTFSKTNYFLDKADRRGATYEGMKEFEKYINKTLKRGHLKVNILFILVPRDQLIPALVEGRGDIAAASLTITEERKKFVDFADPVVSGINEIVVAGPGAPNLSSLEDLSGKEIHVRRSSSYFESLSRINESFKKAGKAPVVIEEASEYLEDEDLLEMVNAGLIPMIVVDDYLAKFWSQIFKDITLHPEIALRKGGDIAWIIRKDSPKLKAAINKFVKGHKKGTLFGNIIIKRYLESTKWARNAYTEEDLQRFKATINLFKKYAGQYDMDWLLVAALAYQESQIDQTKRSPAGAVGVMQLLPSTAAGDPINIPDIEKIDKNIHAGVKYLRWIHDTYFKNEKMDRLNKGLFTFASY